MKSRFLKIVFAAALVVAAGVTAYQAQEKEMMSDLTMENVEALASGDVTTARDFCWSQFTGGLAWPRQCPSCVRIPFATGVGPAKICN